MNLSMSEDSQRVQGMFQRPVATESSSVRVSDAEPIGFDAELRHELAQIGTLLICLPYRPPGAGHR